MNQNYLFTLMHKQRLNVVAFFVLLLIAFAGISTARAQANEYVFSQTNGSFSSLSGATILGTATANSGAIPALDTTSFPVTLPFGFNFNGQNYTSVTISSNGYITFGTGVATGTAPISSTVAWDGAVSAWGANILAVFDIAGKTGNMSWTVEGASPNRVAVFQWENFRPSSSTSATAAYAFSFQIRLAETSNVISTVYSTGGNLLGTNVFSGTTVQIGLRGATNSDFNNRTNAATTNFGSSTKGTANSSGQAFNTANTPPGMPADGLTYIWTPPTCLRPSISGVSAITTSSATVSWTASSSAPANGYEIYYSTTNVAPDNTTTPTITGVAGLTTNLSGLAPANTYYVWVRSKCAATDFSFWSETANFSTPCMPPAVLSTTGATVCPTNTATLSATTEVGATLHWLDSTGTEVGTGPTFTTPSLAATTTYFVNASVGLNGVSVGKNIYSPSPTSGTGTTNFGLVFDVLAPFTINSVTVYPVSAGSASGTVIIDVIDAANTVVHSVTALVTGAPLATPVAQLVNLGFYMQPGTNYKMRPRSYTGISGLLFDPSANVPAGGNYGYPFTFPGVLSIVTSTLGAAPGNAARPDLYYYFYDWKISTDCKSANVPVIATVDANCLSTSEIEKRKLKIYPNPFSDVISVSDFKEVIALEILDEAGRFIKTIKPAREIYLGDLNAGLYFIKLKMKDGTFQTVKALKK